MCVGGRKMFRAMLKRFAERGRIYRLDFLAEGNNLWESAILWLHGPEQIDLQPSVLFGEFTNPTSREMISGWNDGQALVTLKGVVVSPNSPFVFRGNRALSTMSVVGPSFGEVAMTHHLNQHRHKPFRLGPDVIRLVKGPIQPKAQLPRIREGVYALMPKFGSYPHLVNELAPRLQMLVSTCPEYADVPLLVAFMEKSSHPTDAELRGVNVRVRRVSVDKPTYVETLHILPPPTFYDLTSGKGPTQYGSVIPRGFSATLSSDQNWREFLRVGRQTLSVEADEADNDFSKILFIRRDSGRNYRLITSETRALEEVEAAHVVDKVVESFFHTATASDLRRYLARYPVVIVTFGSFLTRLLIAAANLPCTLVIIYSSGRRELYDLGSHLCLVARVKTVAVVGSHSDSDETMTVSPEDLFAAVRYAIG